LRNFVSKVQISGEMPDDFSHTAGTHNYPPVCSVTAALRAVLDRISPPELIALREEARAANRAGRNAKT
jgi:hypothetical protein